MNSRNQSLDVLRGVAVLMVLLCHYPAFKYSFLEVGRIGVDLFFVLSGFLISGLLFSDLREHGRIRLLRFYTRRGFKIYPTFYFFLLLTALLFPSFRQSLHVSALFIQNYRPADQIALQYGWGHLWSLDVEEHFYLGLPLLLICLNRLRLTKTIPWIAGFLVALCFVMRLNYYHSHPIGAIAMRTHLRMDGLFAGVALGYLYHHRRERFIAVSRWYLLPIGLLAVSPTLWHPDSGLIRWALSPTFALAGFSLVLLWAVPRRLRFVGWVGEIGQHSYSIYLWQQIMMMFFLAHRITFPRAVLFVVVSVAVGVAMSVIIEQPSLYLREQLFHRARKRTSSSGLALVGNEC